MARQYQWRAETAYTSTTTLSHGVAPSTESSWQTADIGESVGEKTYLFWYRDTNTPTGGEWVDDTSTRVGISVTESWSTSVDEWNYLTVTANVKINSIVRDDVRGGGGANTPGRAISVTADRSTVISETDYSVGTAHTIYSGPLQLATFSTVLAPGENTEYYTLNVHNQTVGYLSWDDIYCGISFKNILPAYYRPGATYSGGWNSTDRSGGACNIYNGSSWAEMKTIAGGKSTNDPPKILHSNNIYYNQRRVGNG